MIAIGIFASSFAACAGEKIFDHIEDSEVSRLEGFDTVGFEPGWSCDIDLPHGRLVSSLNGYHSELLGRIPNNPSSALPLYLFAVEKAGKPCKFYFADVHPNSQLIPLTLIETGRNHDQAFRAKVIKILEGGTRLCHPLFFGELSQEQVREKKMQECAKAGSKRLRRLGVVISDTSDGRDQYPRYGTLIENNVYWRVR